MSIFENLQETLTVTHFLAGLGCSLGLGLLLTLAYTVKTRYTKGFVATIALLPAIVCAIIMVVNGNIGAGVAVAGVFSLVRFRSVPGTAREIGVLFLAMGAGLITGMGQFLYAALFTVILAAAMMLFNHVDFGEKKDAARYKVMNITIPEDLDYSGVFDDIFASYTDDCDLIQVKSTNMGSMFRLTYNLTLSNPEKEKEMIDQLRCRNGNLEISVSRQDTAPSGM